jgi:hypothetical protein
MQALGPADSLNIVRIQFALMKPGTSDIKLHVDSGGYAKKGHRIHVPIVTHPHVVFDVCPMPAPPHQLAADAAAAAAAPRPAAAADTAGLDAHDDDDSNSSSSSSSSHGAPPSSRWWWLQPKHNTPQQPTRQQQQTLLQQQMQLKQQQQMQAPAPMLRGLLAKQQQQQQQFDPENPNTCVKILAPEGLVFELNNRVQHKVANPGPGERAPM